MTDLVVRAERTFGCSPSLVWTTVGDLTRLSTWFPIHQVGDMTTAAPAVGNVVYVSFRRRVDPARAVRLEVCEWNAGESYVLAMSGLDGVSEARLAVRVAGLPQERLATVTLRLSGDVEPRRRWLIARIARRRFAEALRRLEKAAPCPP